MRAGLLIVNEMELHERQNDSRPFGQRPASEILTDQLDGKDHPLAALDAG
jgi:hypothetical protein